MVNQPPEQDAEGTVSEHVNYSRPRRPYDDKIAQLIASRTPEGGRVLDIGCGVGHGLAATRELRPDLCLIATDRDLQCLEIVRQRAIASEIDSFESIEDLRSCRGTLDGVVLSHVLEHTLSPASIIDEAQQLLRDGGYLYLAVPNPVRPRMLLADILRRKRVRAGHVYSWDRSHWMNFLTAVCNLANVQHTQDYVPIPFTGHSRIVRAVERHLTLIFPWFSFSHIAVVGPKTTGDKANAT